MDKWISVKDKKPEIMQFVDIFTVGGYKVNQVIFDKYEQFGMYSATHWCPSGSDVPETPNMNED